MIPKKQKAFSAIFICYPGIVTLVNFVMQVCIDFLFKLFSFVMVYFVISVSIYILYILYVLLVLQQLNAKHFSLAEL